VLLISASIVAHFLNLVVIVLGIMLIGIILIQSGKGGGLVGAFGGMGGANPFGTKSADTVTRVTGYLAAIWAFVIILQVYVAKIDSTRTEERSAFEQLQNEPAR
jgi:preprotein translocase subunit SecG